MNNDKSINDLLNSLDGIKRAAPPDFFYTRLLARMEKEQGSAVRSGWWILKPVYAIALIATVIVVNLAVVLIKTDTQNTLTNDSDRFQTIAADYNLADNGSFYEINQENK